MRLSKEEVYEKLSDLMSREEFENDIKMRVVEYGLLLSEDAVAYIILDENNRLEQETIRLSRIGPGQIVNLRVRVKEVGELRNFRKKDGTNGTMIALLVSDSTSTCRFVLWEKDTELVLSGKVKKNCILRILNAVVKDGRFGLEMSLGKGGIIVVEP